MCPGCSGAGRGGVAGGHGVSLSCPHGRLEPTAPLNDGPPRQAPNASLEEPSNAALAEASSAWWASAGLRRSNAGCTNPPRDSPRRAFDWGFLPHAEDWRPRRRAWKSAAVPTRQELTIQRAFPAPFPSPRRTPAHERRLGPLV